MALATQCPHCATTFRVASDQLKLRGGIVRCGACHEIFDGTAALLDLDAPPAVPAPTPDLAAAALADDAAPTAAAHIEPGETAASDLAPVVDDADPIYTLDFDRTFDPFGILPKTAGADDVTPEAPPAEAVDPAAAHQLPLEAALASLAPGSGPPAPEPATHDIAPPPDPRADEEPIAAALPDEDRHAPAAAAAKPAPARAAPPQGPLPMRASVGGELPPAAASIPPRPARAKPGRRSKLTPTRIAAPKLRVPEIDEPEFVRRSRQQEASGRTRRLLMAVGSAILLLALAAQATASFRNVLAARFPAAKPALAAACSLLGCRVELPAQIENLAIETGELQALGSNVYSLTTQLRNQGTLVQAWPNIELALTDANDKPLLRRVFTPAEYLAPATRAGTGFAARAEQPVKLHFQLDQLKPSGYHLAVFYP
jgi:predicted Zn finger-like uncharacterized protein